MVGNRTECRGGLSVGHEAHWYDDIGGFSVTKVETNDAPIVC